MQEDPGSMQHVRPTDRGSRPHAFTEDSLRSREPLAGAFPRCGERADSTDAYGPRMGSVEDP
jgi:hypothetical protein